MWGTFGGEEVARRVYCHYYEAASCSTNSRTIFVDATRRPHVGELDVAVEGEEHVVGL